MSTGRPPGLGYRAAITGRIVLAAFGGYGVAALSAALLALALPLPRAEATTTGTLASFAILAGVVVWVFAARSLGRAALGLGCVAVPLTGALWLAGAFARAGAA